MDELVVEVLQQRVFAVLSKQPQPVLVSSGAHGAIGSSDLVFSRVALLLCRIIGAGMPDEDAKVWALLDKCWNEI